MKKVKGSSEIVVVLVVGLVAIALALAFVWFVSWKRCSNIAQLMDVPFSYALLQGCMVQTKSGWIPLKNVRDVDR